MTLTDRVEINPRVMLGKPVIRGFESPRAHHKSKFVRAFAKSPSLPGRHTTSETINFRVAG